jgi:hypothetical protein
VTTAPDRDAGPLRVLIVERDAHVWAGHFPNRFAALAAGFVEQGCAVDVLTQRGWLHADERGSAPFGVWCFGRATRFADRSVRKARARLGDHAAVRGIADALSTVVGAVAVRRWARAHGRRDLVVMLSYDTVPLLAGALVGGRVLVYAFGPPPPGTAAFDRWLLRALSSGPWAPRGLRVATPHGDLAVEWSRRLPGVEVVAAPVAGVARRDGRPDPSARRSARAEVGAADDECVVLLFGSGHGDHDAAVVRRAVELGTGLDGVRLVVGGKINRRLEGWDPPGVARVPGYVSAERRDRLFVAADLVLLSFADGYRRDSGTLMDAIAHGVPVVASRGCPAAALVEAHRLGVTFAPGDERSLVHAIRRAPWAVDPGDLARARRELGDAGVAARFLAIAGLGRDEVD